MYVLQALVMAVFLAASDASAATLNVFDGRLLGASNVNVGGNLYNVAFRDGTCIALFSGCDSALDFAFANPTTASNASQALLDQVFVNGPDGDFDSDPSLTEGCAGASGCVAYTPFSLIRGVIVEVARATNTPTSDAAGDFGDQVSRFFDQTAVTTRVYAVWSPVPEPTTALLLGSGLAVLLTRRRMSAAA